MDNENAKRIISFLIIASVFITGTSVNLVGLNVEWTFFIYVPFVTVCVILFHKISKAIAVFLICFIVYAMLTYQYGLELVVRQLLNVTLSLLVSYYFIVWEKYDYLEIFRKYLVIAKVIVIIGFVQVFIFALPQQGEILRHFYLQIFPWLAESNISGRFQSLAQEPSFAAYAFAPAVFLSLHTLIVKRTSFLSRSWSFLFLAGYLLTFSLVAYVGLVLAIVLLYFNNFIWRKLSYAMLVVFLIGIFGFTSYFLIPEIQVRTDDTLIGLSDNISDPLVYKEINSSSYAVLSNALVTKRSLAEQPLFGTGVGTYQLTYDRYLSADMKAYSQLNRQDANSLSFRLLTETGIVGFAIFLFFVLRFRTGLSGELVGTRRMFQILNSGILVLLVMLMIRSGDYTSQARILFTLLYIYTYYAAENA